MRHNVSGRKFNRTKSHKDAMLSNMASSLLEHKKIHTTEAKAKELRPFVEALITKAKHAIAREKQNLLPEGQTIDIHNRRMVYRIIRNKGVIQELFDAIAPVVESRNGGYCRITKTGLRRGDAARTAIIELVDWSAPVDGAVSLKRKKKSATKTKATKATPAAEKVETTTAEEIVSAETIEENLLEETTSVEASNNEVPTTETEISKEIESTEETAVETAAEEVVIVEEKVEIAQEDVIPPTVVEENNDVESTEGKK